MPRTRQIGLTDQLKSKILRFERLDPDIKKNVMYDVRKILEKELEDIEWLITACPEDFLRSHDRNYTYPLDAIMPDDARKKAQSIDRIKGWIEMMKQIIKAFEVWGPGYKKKRR